MLVRILLGLILCFAFPLLAQESESRLKIEKEDDQDDVDNVITNDALRAESGSKSRWSIASDFVFNGGTVQRPFGAERPNVADSTGTTDVSNFEGRVAVKWGFRKKHALMAGVGLRWLVPFEKKMPGEFNGDRFDADNPYLTYQYVYKWAGVQSVLQVQPTYYTNSNLVREGYVSSLMVAQDNMIDIGESRLSLGFTLWGQGAYFSKTGSLGSPDDEDYIEDVREKQSDYEFGVDPVLEFAFNDRYSFRWVCTLLSASHLRSDDNGWTFVSGRPMQSMGIAISITRDVYLYPNVQFLFEDMRADQTNVTLNSNINLF